MFAFALVLMAQQPAAATAPADLIVTNARIYTADPDRPLVRALAVRGGRVLFVGSQRGALALAGPRTERWDLAGRTVIPGIVDAHAHLVGLGQALRRLLDCDFDALLFAHGEPVARGGHQALAEFLARHDGAG